ncbi:unnamed protein product [Lathyrus oleraceus]
MIFSLYSQIILSLSLSFIFHLFNFKNHFHSFFSTNNNNHKCPNPNRPVSSKPKLLISLPPSPTVHDMDPLMVCTESIGFESMPLVDDYDCSTIDENNEGGDDNNDEDCWRNTRVDEEKDVNGNNTFPPPLSSLDGNGLPSYILLPVRINGRLQLNKMNVKRPKTVYADRENGRLRLFLVTDQCYIEDDDAEQEEEKMVEESRYEYEEEKMVEESRYEYEEDDRVRDENNKKRYHCHQQLVNHHIHGSHGNLLMYGVSIV